MQNTLLEDVELMRQNYFKDIQPLLERRNLLFRETPHLWLLALQSHDIVKNFIRDKDTEKALSYLIDISFTNLDIPEGGLKMSFV